MPKLSPKELQIIRSMLIKEYGSDSALLDQLASAKVEVREMTGTGYYADLSLSGDAPRVDDINGDASGACKTSLQPPCDLVGFTVFIRGGYLSWFEGYTFGDVKWPDDPLDKWVIISEYELAKSAAAAPATLPTGSPRISRSRGDSKREAILQLLREHPEGLSRDELLELMKLKGDPSAKISVSNALSALAKRSRLVRREGKYRAA